FAYVPGGPIYKGTVNDPTTFPPPSKSHGSCRWSFECLLTAGLVPLTTAAFVTFCSPASLLDELLGASLIMHSHIGFNAVLVDSVHERELPCPLPPPHVDAVSDDVCSWRERVSVQHE
ncbi:CybS domain containing protein, partial [Lactarius tabidus]